PSSCPPLGIPNCTDKRPSCSTGLNGNATDSAQVHCVPWKKGAYPTTRLPGACTRSGQWAAGVRGGLSDARASWDRPVVTTVNSFYPAPIHSLGRPGATGTPPPFPASLNRRRSVATAQPHALLIPVALWS